MSHEEIMWIAVKEHSKTVINQTPPRALVIICILFSGPYKCHGFVLCTYGRNTLLELLANLVDSVLKQYELNCKQTERKTKKEDTILNFSFF